MSKHIGLCVVALLLLGSVLSEVLEPKNLDDIARDLLDLPSTKRSSHLISRNGLYNGQSESRLSRQKTELWRYPPTHLEHSLGSPGRRFFDQEAEELTHSNRRLSQPAPTRFPPTGSPRLPDLSGSPGSPGSPGTPGRRFLYWGFDQESSETSANSKNNKRLSQPGPTRYPSTGSPGPSWPLGSPGSPGPPAPAGPQGPPATNDKRHFEQALENMFIGKSNKRLSQPGPTKYPSTGSPRLPEGSELPGLPGSPGTPGRRLSLWNLDQESDKLTDSNNNKRLSLPGPPTGSQGWWSLDSPGSPGPPGPRQTLLDYPPKDLKRSGGQLGSDGLLSYSQMNLRSLESRYSDMWNKQEKRRVNANHQTKIDSSDNVKKVDKTKRVSPPGPTPAPSVDWDILEAYFEQERGERNKTLSRCLNSVVIVSSGQWENGGITIQATFPSPAEFAWSLGYTISDAYNTRGKYNTGSDNITSILTLDDDEMDMYEISLYIRFPAGGVYIRLDNTALLENGTMHINGPVALLGNAPGEILVPENGDAKLAIPLFFGLTNRPSLDVFYSFLNTSVHPYTVGGDNLFSTLSPESFTVDYTPDEELPKRVVLTLDSRARLYGGTVNVHLSMLDVSVQSGPSFVKFVNVQKTYDIIRPLNAIPQIAGVAFGSWEPEVETQVFPDCVKHGSINCWSIGNPSPTLRLYKDGVQLKTYSFWDAGVTKRTFYPLDGESIQNVRGVYTCHATSANITIERSIVVVPGQW